MQCYVKSSEKLIQEFSVPYGQLDRLEVCINNWYEFVPMVHLRLTIQNTFGAHQTKLT